MAPVTDAPGTGRRAFIVGLSGETMTRAEAAFLQRCRPCGIILFSRNFANNRQISDLISSARAAAGDSDLLVLVDQEGGRVQRLRGAEWPDFPPAAAFGALYRADPEDGLRVAQISSMWLSVLLREIGINCNCAPCLDVPVAGADAVIGDRAYGERVDIVAALGAAVASGMMAGGVVPVMKHIPGHGRAKVDSHKALPVVDTDRATLTEQDFQPFTANNDLPAAMTAHVTFTAIDDVCPASVSPRMTSEVVRGAIDYQGLLMSDDISMQALAGSIAQRAQMVLDAGSDVILHCNGDMAEMEAVAAVAPVLSGVAGDRFRRCLEIAKQTPQPVDADAVRAGLERVRQAYATNHQTHQPGLG